MGQGTNCGTYRLPNLPTNAVFLTLGTSLDSDGDGLTDAFEGLVSKTDRYNPDSDGDGLSDLDEWLHFWPPTTPAAMPTLNNISPPKCPVP